MNKKIFLTSAVVFGLCCPAFAETFPQDGLMQENTTYDDAATEENLGVTSGSVNATANYENIQYQCAMGTYFDSTNLECVTCPANYYCPSGAYTIESTSNGLNACPSTYPLSDEGATNSYGLAQQVCYRECTTSDISDTHATVINGRYYNPVGSMTANQCTVGASENGYYLSVGSMLKDTSSLQYTYRAINPDSTESSGDTTGLSNGDWIVTNTTTGQEIHGVSTCGANMGSPHTKMQFGPEPGHYILSETVEYKYCYCKAINYIDSAGQTHPIYNAGTENEWVYEYDSGHQTGTECANRCAMLCATEFAEEHTDNHKTALLGSGATSISCIGNTITINWSDASAADIAANNAGQCTFGGDIRTPAAAATKTGKRFLGWTFQKSN